MYAMCSFIHPDPSSRVESTIYRYMLSHNPAITSQPFSSAELTADFIIILINMSLKHGVIVYGCGCELAVFIPIFLVQ